MAHLCKKNAEKKILNEVSESKIKYMNELSLFFNKVQFNDTNLKINYKRILKPSSKTLEILIIF